MTSFQSSNNVIDIELPTIIIDIRNRISDILKISNEHSYLQVLNMKAGGEVKPHYDTGYPNYINYKVNISLLSDDYSIWIGYRRIRSLWI